MSKFRFWHDYVNARGKHYGASLEDGYAVHVRGWDAGVKVTPRVRGREDDEAGTAYTDADEYDVAITWGSNGGERSVHIGTVRDTADGPMWIAEDVPHTYTRTGALARLRTHRIRRYRAQADPAPVYTDESGARIEPWCDAPDPASTLTTPAPVYDADHGSDPDILAKIDSALAGPSLDSAVFGPESNLPHPYSH